MGDIAIVRKRRPVPKVTCKKPIIKSEDLEIEQKLDKEESIEDINRSQNKKKYIDLEEILVSEKSVFIENFRFDIHGLYVKYKDKQSEEIKEKKISDGVYIRDKVYNIDTQEVYTNVLYKFDDSFNEVKCPMNFILPNELSKRVINGFDIPYANRGLISEFLSLEGKIAPCINVYKNVGWHKAISSDDEYIFRHERTITNDEDEKAICDVEISDYDLRHKGYLHSWVTMYRKHIKGNIQLEALICMATSSVIVGKLARTTGEMESLLIHIYGNSTQGKTTGAMTAVSLMGNPSTKNKGLIRLWNGTNNAIMNSLGGNFGIPVVFDELSMSRENDFTSMIYSMVSGKDKARLNDSITQREQVEWSTVIISTGEQSILERTNKNAGLSIRAIEFANIQWTKSAEDAEEIKRVILNNYGIGAESIVRQVNYLKEEGVQALLNKWTTKLKEILPRNKFRDRIANKLAIILVTGEIINDSIRIDLDLDSILNFLVENEEKNMLERDIGAKAFNQIIQKIIENKGNFKINNIPIKNNICWGNINFKEDYYEVAILKNVLEKNLRDLGYGEPKVVVKEWKNSAYLDTENDRTTKRFRLFNSEEQELRKNSLDKEELPKKLDDTTYILKVPKEYLDKFLIDT